MAITFGDKLNKTNYNNTMIVDALNIAFRWKHLGRVDFRDEYLETVRSLARSYKAEKIIIAADWGHSTYRRDLYPEYKADRKERFQDQTEEEKEAFERFFNEYEETLKLLSEHFVVLRFKGVEADDIAAHLVLHRKQYGLENIWLISSDGDWDLLVQEGVSRFSTVTRKEITAENWYDHHDVSPESFMTLKCLTGDKSDNIMGIPGIGPVRAKHLIETYGDLLDIHDALPIDSKYKHIQTLNEHADRLLTNAELMDLISYCDTAIGEENLKEIRVQMGDVPW